MPGRIPEKVEGFFRVIYTLLAKHLIPFWRSGAGAFEMASGNGRWLVLVDFSISNTKLSPHPIKKLPKGLQLNDLTGSLLSCNKKSYVMLF